jgi:hypothetical protein
VENDDEQEGMRFGATVALPVNRYLYELVALVLAERLSV